MNCAVNKDYLINMLDNGITAALYKILKVDRVSMNCLREYLNIPSVATFIEILRLRFMDSFLSCINLRHVVSVSACNCVFAS